MTKIENKNIVKEVCEKLDINQSELAKELGVTTGAISKWNKDTPKIAQKALEYMITIHNQEKQLKILKDFKKMIINIDISQ